MSYIPLQIKEAKVQNGLKALRLQMLASGLTAIFLNIISIVILGFPLIFNGDLGRFITVFLVFSHALGFLSFSLIKRSMYTSHYSDESKKHHARIEVLEKIDDDRIEDERIEAEAQSKSQ